MKRNITCWLRGFEIAQYNSTADLDACYPCINFHKMQTQGTYFILWTAPLSDLCIPGLNGSQYHSDSGEACSMSPPNSACMSKHFFWIWKYVRVWAFKLDWDPVIPGVALSKSAETLISSQITPLERTYSQYFYIVSELISKHGFRIPIAMFRSISSPAHKKSQCNLDSYVQEASSVMSIIANLFASWTV